MKFQTMKKKQTLYFYLLCQKINEIEDDTNEKKLRHYLQKTIDGSKEDEKYAYDGGIMLIELGYEVPVHVEFKIHFVISVQFVALIF